MSPEALRAPCARAPLIVVALVAAGVAFPSPARALKILNYNLLNYPGSSGPARNPHFKLILSQIHPDILIAQEVQSQAGVDAFLANVLNANDPGEWAALPFVNGNDTDGAMFYKTSKFTDAAQWSYYPNLANLLRLVHVYRVRPVGYTTSGADIRFHNVHLKASQGFESQRLAEATGMRDSMNAAPSTMHAFAIGDFNFYKSTSAEPAYGKFMESQADNDGRLYDPLGLGNMQWQDNAAMAQWHTQCPCLSGCLNGSVGGGMDDRFDLILPTLDWDDGQGYELLPATYRPFGNDGQHLNQPINVPPYTVIDSTTAYALWYASDHLPVSVEFQVPAIGAVASALDLGTVIGSGSAALAVSNTAIPPADGLTYTLAPPAGFSAPAGTLELAPGAATTHAIATTPGGFGPRAGTLTLASDDVDHPSRAISLTANVLDHAHASLDSTTTQTARLLDFGAMPAEAFVPVTVSVFNNGWTTAQARLALASAAIAGGGGHFSIADFAPALIGGAPGRWDVAFDTTGATRDSTYAATLTFAGADEALPGAQPQPDLVLTLSARIASTPTSAPIVEALPGRTRLLAPAPNPLRGSSRIGLELAAAADVRLEVVDLAGRRVTTLAHRSLEAGRHAFRWDGRDDGGAPVGAGIYFLRVTGAGVPEQFTRVAVVR